jgi:hypothetical protein
MRTCRPTSLRAAIGLSAAFILTLALGGCPPPTPPGDGDGTGNSGLTGQFAGSTSCAQCHSRIHADWAETLHAQAYETLEAIGQENNEACIGCHVVGFGAAGGFVDRATTNDLAGVGCENCHGPAADHVNNVSDATLRPPKPLASEVCGDCHTGSHHPTFEEWEMAGHSGIVAFLANDFVSGARVNSCGECHSGEFYYRAILNTETVGEDAFEGMDVEDLIAIECAICHDPHARTGNAPEVPDGRDFQLRFPEVANPIATNTTDAATNAARFNLCGQCHHSRGRSWDSNVRGPHNSVQANVYVGEMATPEEEDSDPLVFSRNSVHSFATEQCATCHMYRQDFESEVAPAIAGHDFEVNKDSCDSAGCHPSRAIAESIQATLTAEVDGRIEDIKDRLGDESTWQYSSAGGPGAVSENVAKVRFLVSYIEADGSKGIHNPDYVRSMLDKAEDLLDDEGL